VVIADLFDLTGYDLQHLGADRLYHFAFPRPGAMNQRFRHPPAVIAGARSQVTATVRKQPKARLVRAPHFFPPCKPPALCIHNHRVVVKASHRAFDVVAVKRVEVALNELFFWGHG
jgi:hypothetical protein